MAAKTLYVFLLGAIIGVLYSCSPVKKVLSTPKYYDQVKRQVILRGECANDTVTREVIIDNVRYKDTVIHDSFRVLMPVECHLDTIVNDFSVYLDNGQLWVKWLGKIPVRTIEKKTTHVIVDKAKEAILIDSLSNQERKIYELNNKIGSTKRTKFKLLAIIVILTLLLFRKPLLRLVKPF
ncbi:hypothetical protein EB001_02845 [bacterium]|nr:hypothetical protein [bacterium]